MTQRERDRLRQLMRLLNEISMAADAPADGISLHGHPISPLDAIKLLADEGHAAVFAWLYPDIRRAVAKDAA